MASLERTAYPTLSKAYSKAELQRDFSFSDDEIKWVRSKSKAPFHLNLAVLLKTFQVLRYFPDITDIPDQLVEFIRGELGQRSKVKLAEYKWFQQYRHMNAVRARLGVTAFYGSDAIELAERHAKAMSFVLDLRIPRHPATQSALIWPGIPRPSGHLFHGHPAGQSERSDAGVALLV
ncbi:TPA: DUF4158 domain-containing protein [Pseudomonas aeruginosa]